MSRNLSTNVTYAVVTRHNAATGDSTLWVNPASEASVGVTASDSPTSGTIGGVALRQAGCCTGDLAVGPIKVGTSFANVFSAPTPLPTLTYTVVGANLQLSWNSPLYALQSTTDLSVPFDDVVDVSGDGNYFFPTGVSSPYNVSLAGGPRFFRLKY